jgi:hypothetical protein
MEEVHRYIGLVRRCYSLHSQSIEEHQQAQ